MRYRSDYVDHVEPDGQGVLFVRPRSVGSKFASLACKPSQMIEEMPDGTSRVFRKCQVTNKIYEVVVPTSAMRSWAFSGFSAREVFSSLSADGREFLISNTTPAERDDIAKKSAPNA